MARSQPLSLRSIVVGSLAVLTLLAGAPAAHADGCDDQQLERPFLPWLDPAHYTLVPDGDFTNGAAGWQLDGATVIADNEPWYVHGGDTPAALRLRAGDSATTPPICVGLLHPTMRFFARDTGGALGSLRVDVLFGDGLSLPVGVLLGLVEGAAWGPTLPMPVVANLVDDEIAFRFTAAGPGSAWVIDDVYVDPYGKG